MSTIPSTQPAETPSDVRGGEGQDVSRQRVLVELFDGIKRMSDSPAEFFRYYVKANKFDERNQLPGEALNEILGLSFSLASFLSHRFVLLSAI